MVDGFGFVWIFIIAFVALVILMLASSRASFQQISGAEDLPDEPVMPDYDSCHVVVDPTLTLVQRIKRLKGCEYANSEIVEENFPIHQASADGRLKIIFVRLNKKTGTSEVLQHMDKFGLRPVWIEELLALGEKYPSIHRTSFLIALGSIWEKPDGLRLVPYLEFYGALCYLYLSRDNGAVDIWNKDCIFPAVHK